MIGNDVVAVHGDWLVRADRESVCAIVSDFEHMPEHFPRVARAMRLVELDGDMLTLEAKSASFGSIFPSAKIEMTATLLPGRGYRCTTRNLTFHTTGDEELLLVDDPEGTRINYTHFVTVRHRRCTRGWSRRSACRTGSGRSSIRSNRWWRHSASRDSMPAGCASPLSAQHYGDYQTARPSAIPAASGGLPARGGCPDVATGRSTACCW